MSVVTSQQISKFYEAYSTQEIHMNKDVSRAMLLNAKGVHIRCLGYQWPCIIYSVSLQGAKVIVNVNSPIKQIVEKANKMVSLNFSFLQKDKPNPISVFIKSRLVNYSPYHPEKPELNFMTVEFANRAPDELIYRIGELLDAQTQAAARKDDRIIINPDSMRQLKIPQKDSVSVVIDNIPRKCILRDISFGGAKVIIFGVPTFLVNKPAIMGIRFEDPDTVIQLKGTVLRFEEVQGRKDVAAFAIQFPDDGVPAEYKLRLSAYFRQNKK